MALTAVKKLEIRKECLGQAAGQSRCSQARTVAHVHASFKAQEPQVHACAVKLPSGSHVSNKVFKDKARNSRKHFLDSYGRLLGFEALVAVQLTQLI
jgi:hypothetical protein